MLNNQLAEAVLPIRVACEARSLNLIDYSFSFRLMAGCSGMPPITVLEHKIEGLLAP